MLAVGLCLAQVLAADSALAYPGGLLDPTFNGTGKATLDVGASDSGQGVLVQPDGKIVVVGGTMSGSSSKVLLARYSPTGSLDPSFGVGGTTTHSLAGFAWAVSGALDANGKIVVVGSTGSDFVVARFLDNGYIDKSFGFPNGYVVTDFGGPYDEARDVAIQANGNIVVVGKGGTGTGVDIALAQYLPTGALDTMFSGGKVLTNAVGTGEMASAVALAPGGMLVVAGFTDSGSSDGIVLRYKSNGALDATFNGTGFVTTSFGNAHDGFQAVAVHSSGLIVAGGTSSGTSNGDFVMARYLSTTGALDTSFGVLGKVVTNMGGSDILYRLAFQNPDLIIAVGGTNPLSGDFAVARYKYLNGQLDLSFGPGTGKVTTNFGSGDSAYAAALDATKCTVVTAGKTGTDVALARYRLC